MPTVRRRHTLTSNTTRTRLSGGAQLESFLRITQVDAPILNGNVTQTELQFAPRSSPCPALKCPHDYWWAPKPRKSKRSQQKLEEELAKPYINIMYDRRVIRGPNFGPSLMDDVDPFDKSAEMRRQRALQKIAEKFNCKSRNKRNVIGTVPPVPGRAHIDVQTEKYLEELVARPPSFSVEAQTDLFLERPPLPPYKPAKVGIDASTEIGDGELFHFDAEAQPIIDVLVDGAIENSILEVAQEQEIGAIRAQQEIYRSKREAELAELRRLEAEELRLQAEKERRMRQDCIAREMDAEMQRAVVAAKFLQGHVSSLLPEIWENLEPASDHAKKDYLLKALCPWLCEEVRKETKHIIESRNILNNMIGEIVEDRATIFGGYHAAASESYGPIDDGEEEAEGELEVCSCESLHSQGGNCPKLCRCTDTDK